MKKREPKVSEEQKKKIIKYYKEGRTLYEIVHKLYVEDGIDISTHWAGTIIREFCKKNNLERKINNYNNSEKQNNTEMSKEEIRETLIQALKDGRPCSKVYEIAQRFGIDIEEELKEYGFYIQNLDEENER